MATGKDIHGVVQYVFLGQANGVETRICLTYGPKSGSETYKIPYDQDLVTTLLSVVRHIHTNMTRMQTAQGASV
jgi:hypothetical protein